MWNQQKLEVKEAWQENKEAQIDPKQKQNFETSRVGNFVFNVLTTSPHFLAVSKGFWSERKRQFRSAHPLCNWARLRTYEAIYGAETVLRVFRTKATPSPYIPKEGHKRKVQEVAGVRGVTLGISNSKVLVVPLTSEAHPGSGGRGGE